MSDRWGRSTRVIAVWLVLTMGFAGVPAVLFDDSSQNVAAIGPNVVKVGQLSEIVVWNPLTIEMVEDYIATYLVYSCMFNYDQDWNGPVGDLALSWNQTIHPDNSMTTWINITHNAYFRTVANIADTSHPLTARDCAFTYKLIQNNTGGAWNFYLENMTNIVAVNDYTLRVDTDYTKATVIDDLSGVPIVPMYIWGDRGTPQGRNPYVGMNPDENVGSGPFVFDSWLRGSWYQFAKADNYHASTDYSRTVKIDGILYTVYSDSQALTLAMNAGTEDTAVLSGDINVFRNVLGGSGTKVHIIKQAVQEPGITDIAINAVPLAFRHTGYDDGWNQRDKGGKLFLLDPFVRKAIMMTLNKTYVVNNIMFGLATKADSVIQPDFWHKTIENQVPFDPPAAKQLLIDHGYVDTNSDGIQEATATSMAVQEGWVTVGTPLSGIRCQAPNTDPSWGVIAETWAGWAADAGLGFSPSVENEITMINQAWYKAYYDIWVWHWGWGPEPLGSALSVWQTSEIKAGGDNVQMPMGPWWFSDANSSTGLAYSAFDENLTLALHTIDKDDRKVIVDKLQQWLYDSYCENPPMYDLGLYAFTDYRYDGWGNWQAHPGRSVASDLLWLWFDLVPAANRSPFFNVPPAAAYDVLVGTPKTFSVTVSDPEGDSLLVNWTFGDGTSAQSTVTGDTSIPQTVTITHTYSTVATGLSMYVSLWDHQPSHELSVPSRVNVLSTPNLGPVISGFTHNITPPVYVGTSTSWTCTASDAESGTSGYGLLFTWSWGDGTYTVNHVTTLANGVPYTDTQTHVWTLIGTHNVIVSVWDGFDVQTNLLHNVSTAPQAYQVIVNTAPTVPAIGTMTGLEGVAIPCQATSTDADADGLTFTWDWGNSSYSVTTHAASAGAPVTSTVSHTWALPGNYLVTVYVDDGATHNVSATAIASISSAGTPVAPGSISLVMYPTPGKMGIPVWVNISASDGNGEALDFYIDFEDLSTETASTAGGTTGLQYVNVSHTYAAAGTYTITVYVNDSFADGSHNVSAMFNVEILVDNSPPEYTMQSTLSAYYNLTFNVAPITISDPDGDTLTVWYEWGDGSTMSTGAGATQGATHIYRDVGTFQLNISVDDGMGHNVTTQVSVTVQDSNFKPSIESWDYAPHLANYFTGNKLWFNLTVRDLEGDKVTVEIDFGDGSAVETLDVDVQPNENSTAQSFSHVFNSANLAGFVVTVTASDAKDHSNMTWDSRTANVIVDQAKKGGTSLALIGAIVAIIAIVAIALAFILMKRRKKGEGETSAGMEGMTPPEETPKPPPA